MEAIEEKTIQKVLVQDIEKLTDQTYVVARSTSAIKDFKCIYNMMEIPLDFHLIVAPRKSSSFLSSFNRNNDQRSTGQLIHKSQFNDYHSKLKTVELLVKNAPVEYVKENSNYHYGNGLLNVIVDGMLIIPFPQTYYGGYNYPVSLRNVFAMPSVFAIGNSFKFEKSNNKSFKVSRSKMLKLFLKKP